MKQVFLSLVCAFGCALAAAGVSARPAHAAMQRALADIAPFGIVTVVGQSQAEGGGQTPISPAIDSVDPAQVFLLTKGNQLWTGFEPANTTQAQFGGSAYPSVWPPDVYAGRGPMIEALEKLAGYTPDTSARFVLNMCTRGSTGFYEMVPGSDLWNVCQDRLNMLAPYGQQLALVIIGFEKDSQDSGHANAACDNLTNYVNAYRGLWGDVPVVVVKPSYIDATQWPAFPLANQNIVRNELNQCERTIPNAIFLEGRGFERIDGAHRTAGGNTLASQPPNTSDSNRIVAQMIALAIFALTHSDETTLATPPIYFPPQ